MWYCWPHHVQLTDESIKAYKRRLKVFVTVFYLVVVKVVWFALSTVIPPSADVQGWNISLDPCPSSIPCALESTVAEWDSIPLPPIALLCSLLRWQSLDVRPLMLPFTTSLFDVVGEVFEVGAEACGVVLWRDRRWLSILVIRLSSGPNGRSSVWCRTNITILSLSLSRSLSLSLKYLHLWGLLLQLPLAGTGWVVWPNLLLLLPPY
jgi:hypothetical protein